MEPSADTETDVKPPGSPKSTLSISNLLTPAGEKPLLALFPVDTASKKFPSISPLSVPDVYSWMSGISPLDSDAGLASSVFGNHDMNWLFSGLSQGLGLELNQSQSQANSHNLSHANSHPQQDGKLAHFSPLPDFLNTLVDYNLQTPTNLLLLQEQLSREKPAPVEDVWIRIEKRIKEVLFDQYEDLLSASPKLTLSTSYAKQLSEHPFFEPHTIRRTFHLYFDVFHDHFPILHRPTFMQHPDKISPLLLVSIVTLGAFHDTEDNYKIAVELHERLRWLVFSSQDLIPPKLWTIQTLLLIQLFEKMASSRHQHEVSATFHGAVITLLRRDGSCANMRNVKEPSESQTCEQRWALWIEKESIKRCVLFLFMMDAQHSLLFGHTSFMSLTEIRLALPCSEDLWSCADAFEWDAKYKLLGGLKAEPSFLDTLVLLLGERLLPLGISPFGKLCVLHGLLSVIWHVQQSDPGSLGVNNPSQSIQSRREILERAIELWSFSIMSRTSSLATDVAKVMHRISFITLYTPETSVLDILTFCGSASLIGRPLRPNDFLKAKVSVESWVNSPDSAQGFLHSLLLIHQVIFSGNAFDPKFETYSARTDKLALRPWCLYILTLVVWVYSFFKLKSKGIRLYLPQPDELELARAFSKAEQFVLNSLRPILKTGGRLGADLQNEFQDCVYLLAVVRHSLENCRWDLMKDAYTCLGKLIGMERGKRD